MADPVGAPRRRPTVSDVARIAGVSPKTVSRVINNVATVNEELAARVREASITLGFRPNQAAASLRLGRSLPTIAILVKDMGNHLYGTIAAGAADVAREHRTQLITAHTGETAGDDLAVIDDLCRRRVDGLLVVPSEGDYAGLNTEITYGTPMVFLDRSPTGLKADSVVADNINGARRGVEKLIDDGHRRIGVVLDALTMQTMSDRLHGAHLALRQANLEPDPALTATSVIDEADAARAVESMLELGDPPTAFFCGNNRLCLGVLESLWDNRHSHALVGFDDIPRARLLPRPVTCIAWDARSLGAIGADLLFRRMEGVRSPLEEIVLPTRLVTYPGTGG